LELLKADVHLLQFVSRQGWHLYPRVDLTLNLLVIVFNLLS